MEFPCDLDYKYSRKKYCNTLGYIFKNEADDIKAKAIMSIRLFTFKCFLFELSTTVPPGLVHVSTQVLF